MLTPFEPHWANVALWITCRGLTTGPIINNSIAFSVDIDMFDHTVTVTTDSGIKDSFAIVSMSVAQFTEKLFAILQKFGIRPAINLMPQEIVNPIAFNKDNKEQFYNKELAHAWWRILFSTYAVLQRYHSHFEGETPPVGLMWGTFDIRDARYNGTRVPTTGLNAGYIRRNAMNEAQVEAGWWPGNDAYQKPAYYSFTYPQPSEIEQAKILPEKAYWNPTLMEFVLDYDDLRQSKNPQKDLLDFFESTYKAGSELAGWPVKYLTKGEPV